jgi:hypothetical protein
MSRSSLTRPTIGQRRGPIPTVLPSQQHSYDLYATAGGYPPAGAPVPTGVVVGHPYYSYPGMTPLANEISTGGVPSGATAGVAVGQASAAMAMTPEAMYYYAQYYQQASAVAAAAGALADPSGQQLVLNANAAAATARDEEEVCEFSLVSILSSTLLLSLGTYKRGLGDSWQLLKLQH